MKCPNLLLPFSAAPVRSCGLLSLIFSAHLRTLISNFSVLRKNEKVKTSIGDFSNFLNTKCVVLRLNITNPLSCNNLRLLLTIFITYPISSLSASLTPNGSSVRRRRCRLRWRGGRTDRLGSCNSYLDITKIVC